MNFWRRKWNLLVRLIQSIWGCHLRFPHNTKGRWQNEVFACKWKCDCLCRGNFRQLFNSQPAHISLYCSTMFFFYFFYNDNIFIIIFSYTPTTSSLLFCYLMNFSTKQEISFILCFLLIAYQKLENLVQTKKNPSLRIGTR